jgi:hypothetical protein
MQVREMARRWLGMDHWIVCGFFSATGPVNCRAAGVVLPGTDYCLHRAPNGWLCRWQREIRSSMLTKRLHGDIVPMRPNVRVEWT